MRFTIEIKYLLLQRGREATFTSILNRPCTLFLNIPGPHVPGLHLDTPLALGEEDRDGAPDGERRSPGWRWKHPTYLEKGMQPARADSAAFL